MFMIKTDNKKESNEKTIAIAFGNNSFYYK